MIVRKARMEDVPGIVILADFLVNSTKTEHWTEDAAYLEPGKKKPGYLENLKEFFLKKMSSENAILLVAEDHETSVSPPTEVSGLFGSVSSFSTPSSAGLSRQFPTIENERKLVGYSLAYIIKEMPIYVIDKTGHLRDLYILPEYRGKGIATKFKDETLDWFKKKGIKYASIKTRIVNKKAIEIYKHWGFFEYTVSFRKKI